MVGNVEDGGGRRGSRLRIAVWAGAAIILMLPLVATQFRNEMNWGLGDFVIAGVLLFGTAFIYDLVTRKATNLAYQFAVGLALAAALFLVWVNLAVGIIGSEDERANMMYLGVLAIGAVGAVMARFKPQGMARTLFAMVIAQVLVTVIALVAGLGATGPMWPLDILGMTGLFVVLFIGSALLFRKAERGEPDRRQDNALLHRHETIQTPPES